MNLGWEKKSVDGVCGGLIKDFYEDVAVAFVSDRGHWYMEENPKGFVERVFGFAKKH